MVRARARVRGRVRVGVGEAGAGLGAELGLGLGAELGLATQAACDDADDDAEDDAAVDTRYAREGAHRDAPLQPRHMLPLRGGLLAYDLPELHRDAECRRQHAEGDEAVGLPNPRLAYPLAWLGSG